MNGTIALICPYCLTTNPFYPQDVPPLGEAIRCCNEICGKEFKLIMFGNIQTTAKMEDNSSYNFQDFLQEALDGGRQRGVKTGSVNDCPCPICSARRAQAKAVTDGAEVKADGAPQASDGGAVSAQNAAGILRDGADVYEQRNKLYGDSYKTFGPMMMALFPNGLTVKDAAAWNRLGVFVMMASKMLRYANNLPAGGHYDSALDLSVYSAMLAELTEEAPF